jgi:hypothetical protein
VNEFGSTIDPAVVVEEADRTVLLTPDETVVFEKAPDLDVVPRNRPREVYAGMWGRNEMVTVTVGILALLTVVLIYFFLVVPSNRELARREAESERLKSELASASSKYGEISDTKTRVAEVLASVENFEAVNLPVAATGRNALYQRLNGLMAAYGLVNTSGPDYAPLETVDQTNGNQSDEDRGRAKYRSLFPGVYVTMTVEGSYANLRRFISEIEAGREFMIVSAVELEPSENQKQDTQPGPGPNTVATSPMNPTAGPITDMQPRAPRGKTHGEVVSLRLEMAAYFRRPNITLTTEQ